jgi:hypothetical protein
VLTAVFFDSADERSLFGGPVFYRVRTRCNPTLIIARHWRDPWWRFVFYGLVASIVPGAITNWPFHELRLMGYAVFLLLLTVPALQWLLGLDEPKQGVRGTSEGSQSSEPDRATIATQGLSHPIRLSFLGILLAATVA